MSGVGFRVQGFGVIVQCLAFIAHGQGFATARIPAPWALGPQILLSVVL